MTSGETAKTTTHARAAEQAVTEVLATPADQIHEHTCSWLAAPDNGTLRDVLGQSFGGWLHGQGEALSQLPTTAEPAGGRCRTSR